MGDVDSPSSAKMPPLSEFDGDVRAFARSFAVRGPQIAWLAGAGTSAMSKIPTAGSLIAQFKHALYCSQERLDVQEVDIGDPMVRERIDWYFDGQNGLPRRGHPDEYAAAFEVAYPNSADRTRLLSDLMANAQPNYAHIVLAALMASNLLRALFTTNFDDLFETAGRTFLDDLLPRRPVHVVDLDNARLALRHLNEGNWPLIGKLHGDFRSDRLKNTRDELREQDGCMRAALAAACERFGLLVVGYSGRDESVMSVLREAASAPNAFPAGLHWCYRPSDPPAPSVIELLARARSVGIEAHALPVASFTELATELERAVSFETATRDRLKTLRPPSSRESSPMAAGPTNPFPVLRLNALPLVGTPAGVRVLGGSQKAPLADLQESLRSSRSKAVIGRRSGGELIAAGADAEIDLALRDQGVSVTPKIVSVAWQAGIDPADHGLMLDCLTIGLGRTPGLRHVLARRGHQVRIADASHSAFVALRDACGGILDGVVPKTSVPWAESVGLTLEQRDGRWWVVVRPQIWTAPLRVARTAGVRGPRHPDVVAIQDFIRERTARRYNKQTSAILDAWIGVLMMGDSQREVSTWRLPPEAGVDPTFVVGRTTLYARPFRSSGAD